MHRYLAFARRRAERQADLLVAQPTKLELVPKLNDANTLGRTLPKPILQNADGVIE